MSDATNREIFVTQRREALIAALPPQLQLELVRTAHPEITQVPELGPNMRAGNMHTTLTRARFLAVLHQCADTLANHEFDHPEETVDITNVRAVLMALKMQLGLNAEVVSLAGVKRERQNAQASERAAQLVAALTDDQKRAAFEMGFGETSFYISYLPHEIDGFLTVLAERMAKAEWVTELTLPTDHGNPTLAKAFLTTAKQYAEDMKPLYQSV